MSIVATDVSVRYPGSAAMAVDRVSLSLDPGELLLVAGPNGSGKSSLFRALLGMLPLEHGEVRIEDRHLGGWRRSELARVVGALTQREEPVFPQRVRDAVMLGRWARLGPISPAGQADQAAVEEAMLVTHTNQFADRGTDTLSGGEWQRVRLARALAAKPRYLLLDEPGTALDLAHEMAVLELLRQLADGGLGVLAITHQLNTAVQYADRVLLLDHGRVEGTGKPAEVLTSEVVSRVFQWPVEVQRLRGGAPHLVPRRLDRSEAGQAVE
jgi:iron complex transport system ATP-binding protein